MFPLGNDRQTGRRQHRPPSQNGTHALGVGGIDRAERRSGEDFRPELATHDRVAHPTSNSIRVPRRLVSTPRPRWPAHESRCLGLPNDRLRPRLSGVARLRRRAGDRAIHWQKRGVHGSLSTAVRSPTRRLETASDGQDAGAQRQRMRARLRLCHRRLRPAPRTNPPEPNASHDEREQDDRHGQHQHDRHRPGPPRERASTVKEPIQHAPNAQRQGARYGAGVPSKLKAGSPRVLPARWRRWPSVARRPGRARIEQARGSGPHRLT